MTAAVCCTCACAGLGRAVRLPDQHGAGLPGQHDAGLPDQSGSRMLPSGQFVELYTMEDKGHILANVASSFLTLTYFPVKLKAYFGTCTCRHCLLYME